MSVMRHLKCGLVGPAVIDGAALRQCLFDLVAHPHEASDHGVCWWFCMEHMLSGPERDLVPCRHEARHRFPDYHSQSNVRPARDVEPLCDGTRERVVEAAECLEGEAVAVPLESGAHGRAAALWVERDDKRRGPGMEAPEDAHAAELSIRLGRADGCVAAIREGFSQQRSGRRGCCGGGYDSVSEHWSCGGALIMCRLLIHDAIGVISFLPTRDQHTTTRRCGNPGPDPCSCGITSSIAVVASSTVPISDIIATTTVNGACRNIDEEQQKP